MKHFFIIINMEKRLAEKTGRTIEQFLETCGGEVSYETWKGPRQKKYDLPAPPLTNSFMISFSVESHRSPCAAPEQRIY